MNKYIVISFAFMALAFYELSGGDDFTPRKAELIAEAKAAQEAKEADRAARLANVQPAPAPVPSAVSEVVLRTVPEPAVQVAVTPAAAPEPSTAPAVRDANAPVPTTLISLEQSGAMFARPLTQLGSTPEQARPALVTQPQARADLREVAGSRVNMRLGPGTSYDIVTSLPQGTAVEVIDSDGSGWVKLRTIEEDQVGWMAEYLLSDPTG